MCGIVGYVGPRDVVPLLLDGLSKLEYRGYDSAGVVVVRDGALDTVRAEGKLQRLRDKIGRRDDFHGTYGLGHTRWATHGVPSEKNAHPVVDAHRRVAVIHNGIIENFLSLKRRLQDEGWTFATDTDTEVVANLISHHLEPAEEADEDALRRAVSATVEELEGMYAFAALALASPRPELVAARHGPPLVLGLGDGEQFLASDPAAILAYTKDVVFLENGDLGRVTADDVQVLDFQGNPIERSVQRLNWDPIQVEKGGYKHFMLKEIHEQPQALQDTFGGRVDFESRQVGFPELELTADDLRSVERIHMLACGTSWHAALVGKFLIEELARLPVEVDYGSEYRYRDPIVGSPGFSPSPARHTLSAMEAARERGAKLVALSNVTGSQATRISDGVIYTHAGMEIGVASTKAFTTQLVALYVLALHLRQVRGLEVTRDHLTPLAHLPQAVDEALAEEPRLDALAREYGRRYEKFLYLGRGINYPIALEGALKLKEISYIHAEGYPAGEMKHGPIALIDQDMPTLAVATGDRVYEKVESNIQEVKARGGRIIVLTDRDSDELREVADDVLRVPRLSPWLQPIVNVVPLQLFAYHVGVWRGADVDQPRNLAKSVTVE